MANEFLPLCDVLFNVISLAGYFCDVVFDVVLGYALFERGRYAYFGAVIVLVMVSLVISQVGAFCPFNLVGFDSISCF